MRARPIVVIAIALSAAFAGSSLASASPVDDKVAEATRLAAEIEKNGMRLTALAEARNQAQVRLDQATKDLAKAQANLAAAEFRSAGLKAAVQGRAVKLLKDHAAGAVQTDEVNLVDVQSAVQKSKYAEIGSNRDREDLNKLQYVLEDLEQKRRTIAGIQAQRKAETTKLTKATAELIKLNAEQQQKLDSISSEVRALMTKNADAARANAIASTRAGTGLVRDAKPGAEPPSNAARIAITYAYAQIGKPYVYATAGPETFDCSGLTMRAYGAAGIKMLHYSGYQYRDFPHVPLDALLPGDLVFWGENASEHVGLYIGDGIMIHAPHTGDVVRIAPVFAGVMGASRPWLVAAADAPPTAP